MEAKRLLKNEQRLWKQEAAIKQQKKSTSIS
jgi:hypothetical protein